MPYLLRCHGSCNIRQMVISVLHDTELRPEDVAQLPGCMPVIYLPNPFIEFTCKLPRVQIIRNDVSDDTDWILAANFIECYLSSPNLLEQLTNFNIAALKRYSSREVYSVILQCFPFFSFTELRYVVRMLSYIIRTTVTRLTMIRETFDESLSLYTEDRGTILCLVLNWAMCYFNVRGAINLVQVLFPANIDNDKVIYIFLS